MQSQGSIGFGTLFQIGDGASPEVFTTIGEVFSEITVGATKPLVDVTHHESPNTFREFIVGVAEGDEITVQANWVDNELGQSKVRAGFDAGQMINFIVRSPSSEEYVYFPGIVTHHDVTRPLDDKQVFNTTIKVAGNLLYS